ncbi:SGNH/GDSL hydrolase family protein [Novosphingobium sp. KN65.2]|uniref:SGNH/GDSL hydrolase family protein n=1 Tax=Novosphingobium sp. KN65.2 TaxID=1478134 RepID=UPI0005DEF48C|nr:SGNH/GDSL hydrolase family protein [Novosphingobium sp. KN65.2]CDO38010.1 conserved exported hypothetical protein [Novosphingobium sp. KN65.2]
MIRTPRIAAACAALLFGCATAPLVEAQAAETDSIEAVGRIGAEQAVPEDTVAQSLEGARYVAIGSSFAAGPMLPPGKPAAPGAPTRCGQSMNNYPTLLAQRFGMVLVDRTCSGARTQHLLGPWGDVPAQLASVDAATRLVTVTIGGNDLNYIGDLFSATCVQRASEVAAAGFEAKPCGAIHKPADADYLRVEEQLGLIARRVREAAPKARLVFVQYLTPLPATLCANTPVSEDAAAIVRQIGARLAEITGKVAQAHKAIVVEMNQASANHTPCDAEPWMIGAPKGYDGKQGLQWHLNLAGMKATADGIAYWLERSGVQPKVPQMPTIEQSPLAPIDVQAAPEPQVPDTAEPAKEDKSRLKPESPKAGKQPKT